MARRKEEIKFNVKKVKDTKKTKKEEPKANDINIDIPEPQTEEDIENEKYLESIVDEYLGEFVTVVDGKISVKDTVMIAEKLVEEIFFLKESMRHLIESMSDDEDEETQNHLIHFAYRFFIINIKKNFICYILNFINDRQSLFVHVDEKKKEVTSMSF